MHSLAFSAVRSEPIIGRRAIQAELLGQVLRAQRLRAANTSIFRPTNANLLSRASVSSPTRAASELDRIKQILALGLSVRVSQAASLTGEAAAFVAGGQ